MHKHHGKVQTAPRAAADLDRRLAELREEVAKRDAQRAVILRSLHDAMEQHPDVTDTSHLGNAPEFTVEASGFIFVVRVDAA